MTYAMQSFALLAFGLAFFRIFHLAYAGLMIWSYLPSSAVREFLAQWAAELAILAGGLLAVDGWGRRRRTGKGELLILLGAAGVLFGDGLAALLDSLDRLAVTVPAGRLWTSAGAVAALGWRTLRPRAVSAAGRSST